MFQNLTSEELQFLDRYIEQKVIKIVKEIKKSDYGNMQGWDAKVSSVNGDGTVNAILTIDPTQKVIPNLKNNSGKTLIANDNVYLYSISTLKNAFIGCKK
jgi:hypothetical protein